MAMRRRWLHRVEVGCSIIVSFAGQILASVILFIMNDVSFRALAGYDTEKARIVRVRARTKSCKCTKKSMNGQKKRRYMTFLSFI